jgi:hypothetical protein
MTTRVAPPALPHGKITEVLPDVFFVTGTIGLPGVLPIRFSRNMTIVREGKSLSLINSVRLDEAGLAELDKLGKVEHVIRIAAFHGMDDPFYKERYGAKVSVLQGHKYTAGLSSAKPSEPYFTADAELDGTTPLPFAGKLVIIRSKPLEGLVLLEREGGILIAGDCLQNWGKSDEYFSFPAKIMMRLMGFIKPFNLGPGWLKATKPSSAELKGLLDLTFDHVLPAHGAAAIGNAKSSYRPVIERLP